MISIKGPLKFWHANLDPDVNDVVQCGSIRGLLAQVRGRNESDFLADLLDKYLCCASDLEDLGLGKLLTEGKVAILFKVSVLDWIIKGASAMTPPGAIPTYCLCLPNLVNFYLLNECSIKNGKLTEIVQNLPRLEAVMPSGFIHKKYQSGGTGFPTESGSLESTPSVSGSCDTAKFKVWAKKYGLPTIPMTQLIELIRMPDLVDFDLINAIVDEFRVFLETGQHPRVSAVLGPYTEEAGVGTLGTARGEAVGFPLPISLLSLPKDSSALMNSKTMGTQRCANPLLTSIPALLTITGNRCILGAGSSAAKLVLSLLKSDLGSKFDDWALNEQSVEAMANLATLLPATIFSEVGGRTVDGITTHGLALVGGTAKRRLHMVLTAVNNDGSQSDDTHISEFGFAQVLKEARGRGISFSRFWVNYLVNELGAAPATVDHLGSCIGTLLNETIDSWVNDALAGLKWKAGTVPASDGSLVWFGPSLRVLPWAEQSHELVAKLLINVSGDVEGSKAAVRTLMDNLAPLNQGPEARLRRETMAAPDYSRRGRTQTRAGRNPRGRRSSPLNNVARRERRPGRSWWLSATRPRDSPLVGASATQLTRTPSPYRDLNALSQSAGLRGNCMDRGRRRPAQPTSSRRLAMENFLARRNDGSSRRTQARATTFPEPSSAAKLNVSPRLMHGGPMNTLSLEKGKLPPKDNQTPMRSNRFAPMNSLSLVKGKLPPKANQTPKRSNCFALDLDDYDVERVVQTDTARPVSGPDETLMDVDFAHDEVQVPVPRAGTRAAKRPLSECDAQDEPQDRHDQSSLN